MIRKALVVFLVLSCALPAAARVALAVQLAGPNPVHRDFVAGVADEARERWAMLPPLKAEVVASCKARDSCLRNAARTQGASHLVIIGVSELGESDFVVVLRVVDLTNKKELANFNDLATPGRDPRAGGRAIAKLTFDKTAGLPPAGSEPNATNPDPNQTLEPEIITNEHPYSGVSPISAAGWTLAGVGVAGAAVMGGLAGMSFLEEDTQAKRDALAQATMTLPIAVAVAGVGLAAVGVDALLAQSGDPMDLVPPGEPAESPPAAAEVATAD
jgi:hypothetical protein